MDSTQIAARSGRAVWQTQLVKITASDFTLRLTTGGFVIWGEEIFVQRDPAFGTLGELPVFDDGVDQQESRADLIFHPEDHAALALLGNRGLQMTPVEIWDVALNAETGELWGAPELLFKGYYDFGHYSIGSSEELVIECGTEEALLSEPNEDRRLSDPHHRSIWPGELGMSHVTGLGRKIYWRASEPSGGAISGGGGYGSGVGGGGSVIANQV